MPIVTIAMYRLAEAITEDVVKILLQKYRKKESLL
jgi:hypothetical protein